MTLTFDPKRAPALDRRRTFAEAERWCEQLAWMLRRPVGWLIAIEGDEYRRWHAHVLLIGAGLRGANLPTAALGIWSERNGRLHVQRVTEADRAVMYTTKSAALDGEVELSDTMVRYHDWADEQTLVRLYSEEAGH